MAIESFRRSQKAQDDNVFEKEIAPVEIKSRKKVISVIEDEGPKKAIFEKIPTLKPAFQKDGKI